MSYGRGKPKMLCGGCGYKYAAAKGGCPGCNAHKGMGGKGKSGQGGPGKGGGKEWQPPSQPWAVPQSHELVSNPFAMGSSQSPFGMAPPNVASPFQSKPTFAQMVSNFGPGKGQFGGQDQWRQEQQPWGSSKGQSFEQGKGKGGKGGKGKGASYGPKTQCKCTRNWRYNSKILQEAEWGKVAHCTECGADFWTQYQAQYGGGLASPPVPASEKTGKDPEMEKRYKLAKENGDNWMCSQLEVLCPALAETEKKEKQKTPGQCLQSAEAKLQTANQELDKAREEEVACATQLMELQEKVSRALAKQIEAKQAYAEAQKALPSNGQVAMQPGAKEVDQELQGFISFCNSQEPCKEVEEILEKLQVMQAWKEKREKEIAQKKVEEKKVEEEAKARALEEQAALLPALQPGLGAAPRGKGDARGAPYSAAGLSTAATDAATAATEAAIATTPEPALQVDVEAEPAMQVDAALGLVAGNGPAPAPKRGALEANLGEGDQDDGREVKDDEDAKEEAAEKDKEAKIRKIREDQQQRLEKEQKEILAGIGLAGTTKQSG